MRGRATLTHSGWDQFPAQMVQAIHAMLDGGWKSFVLSGLKAASEAARANAPTSSAGPGSARSPRD